jgi:Protein of unknown function (DUF2845)
MFRLMMLFACCVLISATSADAFRCGSRVISEGAYKAEVLYKCGEPHLIEEYLLYQTVVVDLYSHRRTIHSHRIPIYGAQDVYDIPVGHTLLTTPIRVEDWTYNFGRTRFMQRLRFIHGKLKEIQSMGYGY